MKILKYTFSWIAFIRNSKLIFKSNGILRFGNILKQVFADLRVEHRIIPRNWSYSHSLNRRNNELKNTFKHEMRILYLSTNILQKEESDLIKCQLIQLTIEFNCN